MMASMVEYNAKTNKNTIVLSTSQNEEKKAQTDNVNSSRSHIGDMLMLTRKSKSGSRIPHLFERSSGQWWNPKMDSEILEKQCLECSLEQSISYFQLSLLFIMLACLSWTIYFGAKSLPSGWVGGVAWSCSLLIVCLLVYILTKRPNFYKKFSSYIAIGITTILMVTVFLAAYFESVIMTSVGSFFLAAEVILLLYTVMPLPLHINFILGIVFSFAYEVFYRVGTGSSSWTDIVAHVLLHICIHLVGVQICINLQVRRRSTFWKVGQIIQSSQSYNVEAEFKKVMINSIMPPSISKNLMETEGNIFQTTAKEDGKFRPLCVDIMEDVSILYADIVGFTKMSTNKSAATLVYLLNDLFGRFDALCLESGCEKISTLGDCYYCVAGCPQAREDHAKCCVEMGLGMISAIKDFCADNDLNVDMRIGIHTGIVICGIVGMKRFKFDVWSNDVSFANQMEQWGVPGRIHVSESTKKCLGDLYEYEDGKIEERAPKEIVEEKQLKTYLIVDRAYSETSSTSEDTNNTAQDSTPMTDKENNKVNIQNECIQLPNGINSENVPQDKISQDGGNAQNNSDQRTASTGSRVGVAHENPTLEKNAVNGTYDLDNPSPTDPLLTVKRTSSHHHHHHHSTRDKARSKRSSEMEPKIDQNQILELIGLHGILPIQRPGESVVRMEQDREFVATIKDDPRMKNISNNQSLEPVSMRFNDAGIEEAYRNKFLLEVKNSEPITSFVSARFSFFLDLIISFIVFILVFFASMLNFGPQTQNVAWIIFFCIFFCLELFVIIIAGSYVFNVESVSLWVKNLITHFAGWIPRHILGAIMLSCPVGVMFSHMWCQINSDTITYPDSPPQCTYYLIIAGVVIIQFLNFNQLSSWIRSIIAALVAITVTVLVYVSPCAETVNVNGTTQQANLTLCIRENAVYQFEFILDIILLMLFILIVNKEYEVGYRLTFYSAHEAEEGNKKMENERNQIDQLLHHIIPPRVTNAIREKSTYSQNHENVGVIFGSIINFNEFYEETFAGGKECIRILNELIGDVDEVLDKKEYAEVEKIKTIGSTFMIASGLNLERDPENNMHLRTLMDFCMEMQDVIYEFNDNMVCFTFILRIGFNHGSVTAGVIGTTKLLYDIWGDTVNIASRMDSTGEPGKIQVSDKTRKSLESHYEFKYRGSTYVKGKGDMDTYLLIRPGDEHRPQPSNPKPTPALFPGQTS